MIQANVLRKREQTFISPFQEEQDREYQRKHLHQKFVIAKDTQISCRRHRRIAPFRATPRPAVVGVSQAIASIPNSADELFRQAAEKVDNKIAMNRRIYGGAPCVANTRVPVYVILQMVEEGCSHKQILKAFPTIGKEGLEAALRFSVLVMES